MFSERGTDLILISGPTPIVGVVFFTPTFQQPAPAEAGRTAHQRANDLIDVMHVLHRHPAQIVVKGALVTYLKHGLSQLTGIHLAKTLVALNLDAVAAPFLQEPGEGPGDFRAGQGLRAGTGQGGGEGRGARSLVVWRA